MPLIKRLAFHEIQKIAAGQVIDRPASVVKELIENSIDAGATSITLSIEEGGKKLIRVIDDGSGMDAEDAQTCFLKHATSKITSVEQLATIDTFGFRGEALAAISGVSNVTLITRTHADRIATKVEYKEGGIKVGETASNVGTDITVQDLFYNTPARLKFLKHAHTEQRHIISLVHALSLSHLSIHFKLYADQVLLYNTAHTQLLIPRFLSFLPSTLSPSLVLPFENTRPDGTVHIQGCITHYQYGAYDRASIFCFVNGRWVKNFALTSSLIKGCKNVLAKGKFPAAALFITIQKTLVDINMHPRKEEVAFVHPRVVETLIESAITQLFEDILIKHIPFHQVNKHEGTFSGMMHKELPVTLKKEAPLIQQDDTQLYAYNPSFLSQESLPIVNNAPSLSSFEKIVSFSTEQKELENSMQTPLEKKNDSFFEQSMDLTVQQWHIIGQLFRTYILIEEKEGLFLVDQHAAHERVLYELFATQFKNAMSIPLVFAHIVQLAQEDMHYVDQLLPLLHDHGIIGERFGMQQLIIQSIPVYFKEYMLDDLIFAAINDIKREKNGEHLPDRIHSLRAQMACKMAVKAGDELSETVMRQLLIDLSRCPNRFSCPHGRPTGWHFSLSEIERKFKRRG